MDAVLVEVKRRIRKTGLGLGQAAEQIGVTTSSLRKHLAGEYVRSDSLAKYRRWLAPTKSKRNSRGSVVPLKAPEPLAAPQQIARAPEPTARPVRPRYVVDLFCGCGGLSLGFDTVGGGGHFRTILGLDVEAPMVRVFNENASRHDNINVGRRLDLADFSSEAEVLAFYLDHLAIVTGDHELASTLERLPVPLSTFKSAIAKLDAEFAASMRELKATREFRAAIGGLGSNALDQTKVMDGNLVRVMAWYDNEWGFSNRMLDTAIAMSKLI